MTSKEQTELLEVFGKDVLEGLSAKEKYLSSRYFYDAKGDEIFQQIMAMPEYYLTDAEYEILSTRASVIINLLRFGVKEPFIIYELGAGDGSKTIELLKVLENRKVIYRPIDISANALEGLALRVRAELPWLIVEPITGEYFEVLASLNVELPKLILFLGSNIGNLLDRRAQRFLSSLSRVMQSGDKLLLGVDLKKPSSIILPAYNDPAGITASFNLNLLSRINRELGGNFNVSQFEHLPEYNEETGIARSHLKSKIAQTVRVLGKDFNLLKDELIHTEISRKYDRETLENILEGSELSIVKMFYDSRRYFSDVFIKRR